MKAGKLAIWPWLICQYNKYCSWTFHPSAGYYRTLSYSNDQNVLLKRLLMKSFLISNQRAAATVCHGSTPNDGLRLS